jgi:hypothetical protein
MSSDGLRCQFSRSQCALGASLHTCMRTPFRTASSTMPGITAPRAKEPKIMVRVSSQATDSPCCTHRPITSSSNWPRSYHWCLGRHRPGHRGECIYLFRSAFRRVQRGVSLIAGLLLVGAAAAITLEGPARQFALDDVRPSNQTMERTAGSFGSLPSMKFHPQPAATRSPASRRSSCSH